MTRRHLGVGLTFILGLAIALSLRPALAAGRKSDAEVKVNVEAGKADASGKQVITVKLEINKGWHIYANPVDNETLADARTEVKVGGKAKPVSVKVDYPKGHLVEDKVLGNYTTYEEKVTIKAIVQRAEGDTGPLEVSVKFQACDSKNCLQPATVRKSVP